jgi:hypothetical protein
MTADGKKNAFWHEVTFYKKKGVPTLEQVKQAVIADINARVKESIISGFTYDGNPVWLSQENQLNFKAAYDLAVQTQGATLPVTFKLGEQEDGTPIYHTFSTMEDFTDFYTAAVNYIHQSVADGWLEKDGIDWSPYEQYFNE